MLCRQIFITYTEVREMRKYIWYAVYLTIWIPLSAGLVFICTNFILPHLLIDLPVLSYTQSVGVSMIIIAIAPRDIDTFDEL